MLKQDINNQAESTFGQTESQVKFIKILKPAGSALGAAPTTQEVTSAYRAFGREIGESSVSSSLTQTSTQSTYANITNVAMAERRTGGGCIPVSGLHRLSRMK